MVDEFPVDTIVHCPLVDPDIKYIPDVVNRLWPVRVTRVESLPRDGENGIKFKPSIRSYTKNSEINLSQKEKRSKIGRKRNYA